MISRNKFPYRATVLAAMSLAVATTTLRGDGTVTVKPSTADAPVPFVRTSSSDSTKVVAPTFNPPPNMSFGSMPFDNPAGLTYIKVESEEPTGITEERPGPEGDNASATTITMRGFDQTTSADKYKLAVHGFLTSGNGGNGGQGGPTEWHAKEEKVTILAAPAYIMADSDLYVPIYFQIGDLDKEKQTYKDHYEIESATLTMTLNGTDTKTTNDGDILFAAGDYVTNGGTVRPGDERTWRSADAPGITGADLAHDTNNTRADYSAIIPPTFFHGLVAKAGSNDEIHEVTFQLDVKFKINGQGDVMEAKSNILPLKAFYDENIPAIPLGNSSMASIPMKNIQMCRPDTGSPQTDKYGMKERIYHPATQSYQKRSSTGLSDLTGTPVTTTSYDIIYSPVTNNVFTPSRAVDANTVTVQAHGYDGPAAPPGMPNGGPHCSYTEPGGADAIYTNGNSYLGGAVDEKIGGYAVSYYGYRNKFTAFAGGSTTLTPHNDDTDCLLDIRIRTCTMTPQLFNQANGDSIHGYVYLSVQGADDATPSALALTAKGTGLLAAILALPLTGGADGWEVAASVAEFISASTDEWDQVSPSGDQPSKGEAAFAGFWQTQDVHGNNDSDHPNYSDMPNQKIGKNADNNFFNCEIDPHDVSMTPMTTWTGWLELGAKVEIQLGNGAPISANTPTTYAKFWYNAGFQGTAGEMFKVQIVSVNALSLGDVAATDDYCPEETP